MIQIFFMVSILHYSIDLTWISLFYYFFSYVADNSYSYSEDDMFETQTQVHTIPLDGPESTINKKDEISISDLNTEYDLNIHFLNIFGC